MPIFATWYLRGGGLSRSLGAHSLIAECRQAIKDVEYRGEIVVVNWAAIKYANGHDMAYAAAFPADLKDQVTFLTKGEYIASHDTTGEFGTVETTA
jgi:hypothetical protein